ncbi:5-methylcytosine rRNA methyltransferase NSUN4-like isoform X2 [Varroa destructor]|nr:5-methylcytosine rRNA methyltransferase NSUN4-like isoform X2 [Varroa destructor]
MDHFDAFYSKVFGLDAWRSMRIALLSKKKYCAVVNPFAVTEELIERLRSIGCREIVGRPTNVDTWDASPEVQMTDLPLPMPDIMPNEEDAVFDDSSRFIRKGNTEPLLSFVPATEIVAQEEIIDEGQYFNFLQPEGDSELAMKTHKPLPALPLHVYTFPRGVISDFPSPKKTTNGLFEYYLMDAASLLPVVALGLEPGDDFADFCAAPGGKTLAVAFTQKTRVHFCSDISASRVQRLKGILGSYLPPEERAKITIKLANMTLISDNSTYNKILVDVPCSNDRSSLESEENNIFHQIRVKERLSLPETQKAILTHALRRLRPGGATVYSTCSLSPVQNDSVVYMTLQSFKQMKFVITNLSETFSPFVEQGLFHLYDKCRYGQLVMPNLTSNFGPMYICRIERVK